MNKSDSTASTVSFPTLLTYSTWLVAGIWLIFTGAMLIFRLPNSDNSFFNYFFGAIRLVFGIQALRMARPVARNSNNPQKFTLRFTTVLLIIMMFVMPLLAFGFQSLMMLFGTYQPGEFYTENILRLIFIAVCYIPAIIFADWRLRK